MRRWKRRFRLAGPLAGLLVAAALGACERALPPVAASLSVAEAMTGESAGYRRAEGPRAFAFPEDHGPHPGFRTEWWYLTGNLAAEDGRRFGYQLTFFRNELRPDAPARPNDWATGEVYMGHFALTDVGGGRFHAFDRFARAAQGLAGAGLEPLRVWIEDWQIEGSGSDAFPLRVRAAEGDVALDLVLQAGKPPVLQGEEGFSQKGPEPGNASYYYSLTRMPSAGTIRIGGQHYAVEGASWMDREWSTSALGPDQVGWDWFSLQLEDGREIMYYEIRRRDGSRDPLSTGTLIGRDGTRQRLALERVRLEVVEHWTSPRTGVRYPARWRLSIPDAALELEIVPLLADQELDLAFRYWEGAVRVLGGGGGGRGYVEMTGYDRPGR